MIIDCISDLHGELPLLEGGDLLLLAGDYTASDQIGQWESFYAWLKKQDYEKKIYIGGNHDNFLLGPKKQVQDDFEYLCDSGTEYKGLKIWGSPWCANFAGMNPLCMAFTCPFGENNEEFLEKYWNLIPTDTDILITHSPPYGILDKTDRGKHVGSVGLNHVLGRVKPKYHIFGHIHEEGGKTLDCIETTFINASIMNEVYDPVNDPVRIITL